MQTQSVPIIGVHLILYSVIVFLVFWLGNEINSFLWCGLIVVTAFFAYKDPLKVRNARQDNRITIIRNYGILIASVYIPALLGYSTALLQEEFGLFFWIVLILLGVGLRFAWPTLEPHFRNFQQKLNAN
jgi:hypothetical protein